MLQHRGRGNGKHSLHVSIRIVLPPQPDYKPYFRFSQFPLAVARGGLVCAKEGFKKMVTLHFPIPAPSPKKATSGFTLSDRAYLLLVETMVNTRQIRERLARFEAACPRAFGRRENPHSLRGSAEYQDMG